MNERIKILGISGSLRKGSYNSALLRAAKELTPADAEIEILDIGDLPLFNQDYETKLPALVVAFKEKVALADAILFVSPEYNYSYSGVIKNAIDWGTRPWGQNSFAGKPAAVVGASGGMLGTARMQYHLRQVLQGAGMNTLLQPEIFVANAQTKFDENGNLTDEETKKAVVSLLTAFIEWTRKIKG